MLRFYISPNILLRNHIALPVEKIIAVGMYFLKNTGLITMTGNTFRIRQCTLTKVVRRIRIIIF